jgi:hypothetical protein
VVSIQAVGKRKAMANPQAKKNLARSLAIEIKHKILERPLSEEDRKAIEEAAGLIVELLSNVSEVPGSDSEDRPAHEGQC